MKFILWAFRPADIQKVALIQVSCYIYGISYVIVIPCPQGLYGVYCLSPRVKAINPMQSEGRGITILKPTMATHLHCYSSAHPVLTSSDHNHSNYSSSIATV